MSISKIYVIHHSHTDIGYTNLQANALDVQTENIRKAMTILSDPENSGFRWNCETLYPVACFLEEAEDGEKKRFFDEVRNGNIGLSLNWLNFTDLVETSALKYRIGEMKKIFEAEGIHLSCAMNADINGISMGHRDALTEEGAEFLLTAVNATHGKAPVGKRHTIFRWTGKNGRSLTVLNGEHYNLGNCLGLKYDDALHPFTAALLGPYFNPDPETHLREQVGRYLKKLEDDGYPYGFLVVNVSGVFTDNAPPNSEIIRNIRAFNSSSENVKMEMMTLDGLKNAILPVIGDIPTYRGDLNDWWADGVASTPGYTKHYLAARRVYRELNRFFPEAAEKYPARYGRASDELLLFAEHTWGHSGSVSDPYESIVNDLDLQNASYAAKAYDISQHLLNRCVSRPGSSMQSYSKNGSFRVIASPTGGRLPVEFVVERDGNNLSVTDESGKEIVCQCTRDVRGIRAFFYDDFKPGEVKNYRYCQTEDAVPEQITGTSLENDRFALSWTVGGTVDVFTDKSTGKNLILPECPIFTPMYDYTDAKGDLMGTRGRAGLNRRGENAARSIARIIRSKITCRGVLFSTAELEFELDGCKYAFLKIKMYNTAPRIDFSFRAAKELRDGIENILMPVDLDLPGRTLFIRKGMSEAFRPGKDQVPHTCQDFSMSDDGVLLRDGDRMFAICAFDTPLYAFGEPAYHADDYFEGEDKNYRPVYSVVMENLWETNFKLDLSGYQEFRYRLEMLPDGDPDAVFDGMSEWGAETIVSMNVDEKMI